MPRPGHVIALAVFALLCLGSVMVQSALMTATGAPGLGGVSGATGDGGAPGPITFQSIIISRQTGYMVLALLAMVVVSRLPILQLLDARRLGGRWPGADSLAGRLVHPFLLACAGALVLIVCLVYIPGLGREVNGSHRWLHLPLFGSMQPSEFAKWGLIPLLALFIAWKGEPQMRRFLTLMTGLALAAVVSAVVINEDLGTGALMLATSAILLAAGGGRIWQMFLLAPPALAGLALAVIASPYRLERLETFLDPYLDPQGAGYHMIQSMVAVANGEVFGRGLGFGLQKFGYLPEDHTDFLFAVICEELGIAGASLVVALYFALLWAGWSVVRRIPHDAVAARLTAIGVLATIGLQAVINMGVVTGLGPTKGIALPLLSAGGTGWILTAGALGALMALDRQCDERRIVRPAIGSALEALPASEPMPSAPAGLGAFTA